MKNKLMLTCSSSKFSGVHFLQWAPPWVGGRWHTCLSHKLFHHGYLHCKMSWWTHVGESSWRMLCKAVPPQNILPPSSTKPTDQGSCCKKRWCKPCSYKAARLVKGVIHHWWDIVRLFMWRAQTKVIAQKPPWLFFQQPPWQRKIIMVWFVISRRVMSGADGALSPMEGVEGQGWWWEMPKNVLGSG